MAEKIADAFVEIDARTRAFETKMSKVRKRFGAVGKRLGQTAARAGIAIGVGLVAGVTLAITAAAKQESAEKKLAAVLKATGNAAGLSAKEIKAHAAELQKTTKFGDEVTINTQAILATFKEIKGDQFKAATVAILDMSTVLDQDAKQGAIALGKALNDPIRGVTALSRVGVTFTDQQREQIRVLQESGDIMGAQNIILKELQSEFGGAAKAAGDTTAGAFAKLKNAVGDAFEQIGFMITQSTVFRDLMKSLTARVARFTERLKKLKEQDVFERLIMTVRLFLVNFTTTFKKILAIGKGVFTSILETVKFVGQSIGVAIFNTAKKIQVVFTNMKENVEALFVALWNKVTNPSQPFVMPDFKALTQGLSDQLVKGPDAPTKAWARTMEELEKIEAEATKKRAQINDDFVRQVSEKNAKLAEDEKANAFAGAAAVVKAEEQKSKAKRGFIGLSEAIKKAQEAELQGARAGARAAVAVGGARPAAVNQGAVRGAARKVDKAVQQREAMIRLLDSLNKKGGIPIFG